jgi:hypothetical protein
MSIMSVQAKTSTVLCVLYKEDAIDTHTRAE